jgi:hypothetical protein
MAKSPFAKRDEQYEMSRRALIKWSVAAGAALGVSRSKIVEILEGTAGKGIAFAAATNATERSVHLVAGNGGLAWFQLLWPQPEVGMANNPNFAYHLPGQASLFTGTTRPLCIGPDTPFATLPAARQMTGFVCGNNETHTSTATSTTSLNGNNIHAVAATLQATTPTVIPAIQFADADFGTALGAPSAAQVPSAADAIGLFNSAASRAGGLLEMQGNAQLYKAQYDAFAQLNRAAGMTTQKKSYFTASGAAQFLGTNLAAKLSITQAERDMYGLTAATPGNVRSIGETLIFAAKSFSMGLTNTVVLPAMRDDPHGAFADGRSTSVPPQLKKVLDGFMTHLSSLVDSVTGETLADRVVITVSGDTMKNPLDRNGWPDGTPNNSNFVFVLGAGHLKTGWFGQVKANGQVDGFDGQGNVTGYQGANQAKLALASIAYAIAKRDDRAITQFANGIQLTGLTNPKDQ